MIFIYFLFNLHLDSLPEGLLWLCMGIDFKVFAADSKDNLLVFVGESGPVFLLFLLFFFFCFFLRLRLCRSSPEEEELSESLSEDDEEPVELVEFSSSVAQSGPGL
jgi:hypothetical protein